MWFFKRLPKPVRVLIAIWFIFTFVLRCSRDPEPARTKKAHSTDVAKSSRGDSGEVNNPEAAKAQAAAALKQAAEELRNVAKKNPDGSLSHGLAKLSAEFASGVVKNMESGDASAAMPLVETVPFGQGITDGTEAKFAGAVFNAFFAKSATTLGPRIVIDGDALANTPATQLAHARDRGAAYFLNARIEPVDGASALIVRLEKLSPETEVWSHSYPIKDADPDATAAAITEAVLAHLPSKP